MENSLRPICRCGKPHRGTLGYAPCMRKESFRSGARHKNQTAQGSPLSRSIHPNQLTEAAEPEVLSTLSQITDPAELAAAVIDDCRRAQKRFYRAVLGWDSELDPTALRELTDFADPRIAFSACIEVSDSLMRRYPGILSMTGTELVSDHPADNPLQLHHHSATVMLTGLPATSNRSLIIDFTMAQLHPERAFPWIGTRLEWIQLVNMAPSSASVLSKELSLI